MRCKLSGIICAAALSSTSLCPAQDAADIPVNIGQSVKNIRVPHFNSDGKISVRMNAATAERADQTKFNFDELKIEIFDRKTEQPALEVLLSKAVYDRRTNQLTSKSEALITGENIEITGSRLDFDVNSRASKLQGPVTMTLRNTENLKP
jgi:hypothetical protein